MQFAYYILYIFFHKVPLRIVYLCFLVCQVELFCDALGDLFGTNHPTMLSANTPPYCVQGGLATNEIKSQCGISLSERLLRKWRQYTTDTKKAVCSKDLLISLFRWLKLDRKRKLAIESSCSTFHAFLKNIYIYIKLEMGSWNKMNKSSTEKVPVGRLILLNICMLCLVYLLTNVE